MAFVDPAGCCTDSPSGELSEVKTRWETIFRVPLGGIDQLRDGGTLEQDWLDKSHRKCLDEKSLGCAACNREAQYLVDEWS